MLTAACKVPEIAQFSYGGLQRNTSALIPTAALQEAKLINENLVLIPKAVEEKIGLIFSYAH
jgi:hypothetical protein